MGGGGGGGEGGGHVCARVSVGVSEREREREREKEIKQKDGLMRKEGEEGRASSAQQLTGPHNHHVALKNGVAPTIVHFKAIRLVKKVSSRVIVVAAVVIVVALGGKGKGRRRGRKGRVCEWEAVGALRERARAC